MTGTAKVETTATSSSSSSTGPSSRRTATGCWVRRSRPTTRCRRRSCARGAASIRSRAAPRCDRGSTGSRATSASTCCAAASGGQCRSTSRRPAGATAPSSERLPEDIWLGPIPDAQRHAPATDDPAEQAVVARVGAARVRRRAATPAAAAAGRAHPARSAEVEGERGRRAARHDGAVGQQRAAAGASDARRQRNVSATRGRARRRRDAETCSRAMSTRSSASTSTRWCRCCTKTRR